MSKADLQNPADAPHILVIDDDDRIRQLVSRFLEDNGFIVFTASSAAQARTVRERLSFDALVVDIMMPDESGLEYTKALRGGGGDIPVILLTALGETEDKLSGFESGADDYLAKPFEPQELVARLKAILKRRTVKPDKALSFRMGKWRYNPDHKELDDGSETIRLTDVEANLLEALARYRGQTVSREELSTLCDVDPETRAIDVQVTRLRRKLENDPKNPRFLLTVRGKGYRLLTETA